MMSPRIPCCLCVTAGLSSLLFVAALDAQTAEHANAVRRQLQRQVEGRTIVGALDQQPRRQDPIQKLISDLETGDHEHSNKPAYQAYRELRKLGVLVLPAIHKRLLDLNPFGIRASLALAVEYPTPELYRNLTLMLEDRDLGRQILAAQALFELPKDKVQKLVTLASRSAHPIVRLGGLHAQAVAGADPRPILAEIKPLLLRPEEEVRRRAMVVLGSVRGPDVKHVLADLLISRSEEYWIAEDWIRRTEEKDEAAALALFERLQNNRTRAVFVQYVLEHRPSWLRLQARGLEELQTPIRDRPRDVNTINRVLDNLRIGRMPPGKKRFRRLFDIHDPTRDYKIADKAAQVALLVPKTAEWVGLLEYVMFSEQVGFDHRSAAMAWLFEVDPSRPMAHFDRILGMRHNLTRDLIQALSKHGNASHLPALARYLREEQAGDSSIPGPIAFVIERRSDKRSLPALIDLFELPTGTTGSWTESIAASTTAMERWFAREHIPVALGALPSVDGYFAYALLDDVERVAGRQDAALLAKALRASLTRLGSWQRRPSPRANTAIPESLVIRRLVHILGKIGGDDAVAALRSLLTHRFADLRQLAFRTLMRTDGVDKRKLLLAVLGEDGPRDLLEQALYQAPSWTDPAVRELVERRLWTTTPEHELPGDDYAAYLSRLSVPQREELAQKILKMQKMQANVSVNLVHAALSVLGSSKEAPRLVPQFAAWIKHPNTEVRSAAIHQLGRTYTGDAVPHLLEALKDEDSSIRSIAQSILMRFEEYQKSVERFEKLRDMKPPKEKGKDR